MADVPSPPSPGGASSKIKDVFKKYGKVALGVHLVVYTSFFAGKLVGFVIKCAADSFLFSKSHQMPARSLNQFTHSLPFQSFIHSFISLCSPTVQHVM